MKITKKRNYEGSLRHVWTDDWSKLLAVFGTVREMMELGVITECSAPDDSWICIPVDDPETGAGFGSTWTEAILDAGLL